MMLMNELMLFDEMDRNMQFFQSHLRTIKEQYKDQFVAIKDGSVFASGSTLEDISKILKEKKEDISTVLVQFISSVPFIL